MSLLRRIATRNRLLWSAFSLPVVLEHLTLTGPGPAVPPPWWMTLVAVVAIAVAVGVRRAHPSLSLAIAVGLALVALLRTVENPDAAFPVSYLLVVSAMSWLAGRRTDRAHALAVIVSTASVLLLLLGLPLREDLPLSQGILSWSFVVLQSLLVVVLPWLLGRYRRQQTLLASAGWERAERMEHEQRMVVDQARLRERTRIAQDMHDSLGHELSLIALRAGALEMAPDLDERHRVAAGELRVSAATATERLGTIIGVLRDQAATAPLQPADETIVELVDRATNSGLDIRLVLEGGSVELPAMVGRAAHRVVQEALTNAAKHAPGAAVTVRVQSGSSETLLAVTNGPPERQPAATQSGQYGLESLVERVRTVGGTLHFGPLAGGGFEVTARLPHETPEVTTAEPPVEASSTRVSESAAELATAQRRARRGLITAVAAPLALALGLGGLIIGYYVVIGYSSVLDAAVYERLEVGQQRSVVEPRLPTFQMVDPPSEKGPAPPQGSSCEFYRSGAPLSTTYAYRLCFDDGTLVAKDVIQTGSVPVDPEAPR